MIAFSAFMVIGRFISGVHWITDIIGGAILSVGLVLIYYAVVELLTDKFGQNSVFKGNIQR